MSSTERIVGLDIGHIRIGVAFADTSVKIANAHATIAMNEQTFVSDILRLTEELDATKLIIGYPRNQSGEATKQSVYVESMVAQLKSTDLAVHYQDESLTSVLAKERLEARGGRYDKAAIDAEAAAIILQDYLELLP